MTDPENHGWDEEIERLRSFLAPRLKGKDGREPDVSILLWGMADHQPRIAEVDYFFPDPVRGRPFGGGATFMQVDGVCAPVIFAAERALLAYRYNNTDGFPDDMIEEAEGNLVYALEGGS